MTDALPLADSADTVVANSLLSLLERRRSVDPDFLGDPGPSPEQTARLLKIAARVPDHGALEPWRFIVLQGPAREAASARMAAAYQQALATDMADMLRDNPEKAARTQAKMPGIFTRAPLVVVVVSRADAAAKYPEFEQLLSVGAACQNLIVAATAMGFGADWLTGWCANDPRAREILGVRPGEQVAGIIHIGTTKRASPERRRPEMGAIATYWSL